MAESKECFEKRSLKKGSVNWVLLMSLGIACAISGDFSGWNNGIGCGGWLGMLIAFLVMGAMYPFMVLGLAEMSSAMPAAGAGCRLRPCARSPAGACPRARCPACPPSHLLSSVP